MIQDHGWVSSQGEKRRFFWIMSLSETVMESEGEKTLVISDDI